MRLILPCDEYAQRLLTDIPKYNVYYRAQNFQTGNWIYEQSIRPSFMDLKQSLFQAQPNDSRLDCIDIYSNNGQICAIYIPLTTILGDTLFQIILLPR